MKGLSLGLAVLTLSACASLAPDYQTPAVGLPADRPIAEPKTPWWETGADATLRGLIDEALAHNADLLVAAQRIAQAQAALGIARADQWPDAGIQVGASRERDQTLLPGTRERYSAQVLVSWELDLWGKYRDASTAARELLFAAEANREGLRLSLASQVAQAWYALAAETRRVALVEQVLAAQTHELALLRKRVAAGVAGEFELRQLEAEVAGTRILQQQLLAARAQVGNALGLLLGRSPKTLVEGSLPAGEEIVAIAVPASLPEGLPSTRLLNRPDVQAAEAALRAANAQIGVARAAWFPSLSLTASGGGASTELSTLFDAGSRTFSIAGALLQPLAYSGRIGAGIDAATAGREAAELLYRQTLARAFREVLDAIAAHQSAREVQRAESMRVAALGESLRIARRRFEAGLTSQFELLANERALLAAQANLVDAQRGEAAAAAQLWTALGG
jgi:multidrug efflux system outer membrane protein